MIIDEAVQINLALGQHFLNVHFTRKIIECGDRIRRLKAEKARKV